MGKTKKRIGKTKKRIGKTKKRMGKTKKRMGKRGGDASPELSDEEKKVQQYLNKTKNLLKNHKFSIRSIDRDHVVYTVDKLLTMEPTEIEVLRPEYVGYYFFNNPKLRGAQRKALAKVLVKKIEQDEKGEHMKRSGILDDFRWTSAANLLQDWDDEEAKPFYDGKHLTHKQIKRVPYDYLANDLDPGLYGNYQDSWQNFERIGSNSSAFSKAIKRKENLKAMSEREREQQRAAPAAG